MHIEWQSTNDPAMAARMALYDLLLAQTYKLDVLGAVLYLGNDPLRMKDTWSFFDFWYRCKMIDVRQLDPEIFLSSDNAGEVMFAILAGSSDIAQKKAVVHRILAKLQELFAGDAATLRVKIKQLELLSLLRGKTIQQFIIQEEQKMPVTIDIREDLRYQQGVEVGQEEKSMIVAEKLLKRGMDILSVQEITGLSLDKLQEIVRRLEK